MLVYRYIKFVRTRNILDPINRTKSNIWDCWAILVGVLDVSINIHMG